MAITVSEIVTAFGSYYLKGQNNMARLVRQLLQGSETLNLPGIRHLKTEETVYQSSNVTSSEAVQAYQHTFTAKGDTEFHPNQILLRELKVDQTYAPDVIEDNWLGFLASENQELKDWPIVRYILEKVLVDQIENDRETKMVYGGVYSAPTAGTAGDAEDSIDGFNKILKDITDASHVYPAHTVSGIQTLTSSDIFDQVEAFEDAIPSKLKQTKMYIFVSPEMEKYYLRKKRALGFYQVTGDGQIHTNVDFTNHTVVGIPSMAGTLHMWATTPENILHITKRNWNPGQFMLQADKRDVNVLGSWWEGYGFADNDKVYVTSETIA